MTRPTSRRARSAAAARYTPSRFVREAVAAADGAVQLMQGVGQRHEFDRVATAGAVAVSGAAGAAAEGPAYAATIACASAAGSGEPMSGHW